MKIRASGVRAAKLTDAFGLQWLLTRGSAEEIP